MYTKVSNAFPLYVYACVKFAETIPSFTKFSEFLNCLNCFQSVGLSVMSSLIGFSRSFSLIPSTEPAGNAISVLDSPLSLFSKFQISIV